MTDDPRHLSAYLLDRHVEGLEDACRETLTFPK